jgi:hypothetical protein
MHAQENHDNYIFPIPRTEFSLEDSFLNLQPCNDNL